LEIATEQATKMAMVCLIIKLGKNCISISPIIKNYFQEGKLPKGEELLDAIKTKSLEQLASAWFTSSFFFKLM